MPMAWTSAFDTRETCRCRPTTCEMTARTHRMDEKKCDLSELLMVLSE